NKWAINIGLVKPPGQLAAACASPGAGLDELTRPAELGYGAGLLEWHTIDDILAQAFQIFKVQGFVRPVNTGQHFAARAQANGLDSAAAAAAAEPQEGPHQRLVAGDHR